MDIKNRKIQSCIQIDHPDVNEYLHAGFTDLESALENFKKGNYEYINHCDRTEILDVYNSIRKGDYKASSLKLLNRLYDNWDVLVVVDSVFYLIEFEQI